MIGFLFANSDARRARSVLLIQSGAPDLLMAATDRLRAAHPKAAMVVLLQRDMDERVERRPDVEYLVNLGSKIALARELRHRRFDAAYVMYTAHPGYWKLKLLPFALGAKRVLAFNEGVESFPINLRDAGALARHLRWRFAQTMSIGSGRAADRLALAAKAAVYPALVVYLLAWERLAHARRPGAGAWKRSPHDDGR